MSIMRCIHCDTNYDSDFEEWCPRCIEKELDEDEKERCEGWHGQCMYCGRDIGD